MKTPFGFASWNMIIGFIISWGLWVLIANTIIKWGWITVHDGFIITVIFTITSWVRTYIMDKYRGQISNFLHKIKDLILRVIPYEKDKT